MKALTTLKSAVNQSSTFGAIALVMLVPVIIPHLAFAADQTNGQTKAAVFEINVSDPSLLSSTPKQNSDNPTNSISIDTVTQSDPLVVNLDAFLTDKGSPLAGSASKIVTFPHWQRALAISVVESNICVHTPMVKTKKGWIQSYNCSGITGSSGYRIYSSYMSWVEDMNNLLASDRYIDRPIEKFINYYVQPGSPSWLYGVKKTEAELAEMEQQAEQQRRDLAQLQNGPLALATFPEK